MKKKVTIIVPVYNAEKYLDRCIESLVMQSYSNLEILLIDDKSTDMSLQKCKKWEQEDRRIKVFEQKVNQGQAVARNKGLEEATGELITFVDSDDWVDINIIRDLYENLEKFQSDVSCCGFKLVFETGREQEIRRKTMVISSKTAFASMLDKEGSIIGNEVCGKLFKKTVIQGKKFREHMLYEDAQMMLQVLAQNLNIACIGKSLYYYYIRNNSTMRKRFGIHEMDRLKVWKDALEIANSRYPDSIMAASVRKLRCELYLYYKFSICPKSEKTEQILLDLKKSIQKYNIITIRFMANLKEKMLFLCIKTGVNFWKYILANKRDE